MKVVGLNNYQNQVQQGFTLVEVMIAGMVMGGLMIGISQIAVQAMAGNNKQKNRMSIEAAINNDIQIVQQKDSQLTYQWIKNNDDPDVACKKTGSYLAEWINNENKFVQTIPENSDKLKIAFSQEW